MAVIQVPHNFIPRWYQIPSYNALSMGYKRIVKPWHRRAGKDKTDLAIVAKEAFKLPGSYYYFYPEAAQGRKAIWEGMDKAGFKFMDYFPKQLIRRKNEQEMLLELTNGSVFRIIGTDNFDSKMGTNPLGCVFSEYSLQKPEVWDYIRPILLENGGWALFNFTFRGHNHAFDLYKMAMANPDWFCERLVACEHPVFNPKGECKVTNVLTPEQIDAELAAGMSEAKVRQEFFCDPDISGDQILIPFASVESAFGRNVSYLGHDKVMGVDIGMSLGGDPSAIVVRQGGVIIHIEELRFNDSLMIAGKIKQVFQNMDCKRGFIDCISWGAGVFHYLRGWGLPFAGINVAESASESDRFNRQRDELWWRGMEFFADKTCSIVDSLPLKGKLAVELSTPNYDTLPNGKIKVEGKADLLKRGVPSPNVADAFLVTLADGYRVGATTQIIPANTANTNIRRRTAW